MKIAWYSNSPTAPTGYGAQTKQVTRRLRDAGHEVHIISNYGQGSGNGIFDFEGIPVWPQGTTQYSTDVLDATIGAIDPDFVVTLYDVWVLKDVTLGGKPSLHWTPVDHDPVVPEVVDYLRGGDQMKPVIAMSQFGKRALADKGIPSAYIPHAIEKTFQPRGAKEIRAALHVPEGAWLVGIVAANIGVHPPRKMWMENLSAVAEMMRRHDDAYLYLHTDLRRPNGANLEYWLQMVGADPQRVRLVDPLAYRIGVTTEEQMSYLYSAFDVSLLCSGGEGFGIPVIESMRCGTPAVVTNFSAQPELVADSGWAVGYQLLADYAQGSFLATPNISEIVAALEESYAERGTPAAAVRSVRAREIADGYDADTVFESGWTPLLNEMQLGLNKAKAAAAGITVPANAGRLVGPSGQPLNRQQRRAIKKGRK